MANGITKPKNTEIENARMALVTLANEGFIKFPVAGVYVGNFMTELAQEYVMLNKELSPSSPITVLNEVGGLFGKRSIEKYLEKLA
jgi:hypothetical protein